MYKISENAVFFLLLRHIANDYDEYDGTIDRKKCMSVCARHSLFLASQ